MNMNLIEAIAKGPLICDGAMGTQLIGAGLPTGACGIQWGAEHPEVVQAIHRRYLDAGCDMVITNTFQGSREALKMHGLSDQAARLNRDSATIARAAAGSEAFVLGDCGPFGGFLEPLGDTTEAELTDIFVEQFTALRDGGADAALIETMSDTSEVAVAIRAAKQVADWPVISSYAFAKAGDGFATMMGGDPAGVVQASVDAGADVVGANCGTDLDLGDYVRLAEALVAAAGQTPVILQPNAGSPKTIDGKLVYVATAEAMADTAVKLRDAGVRIIGGCCGTTPEHLAAMATAVKG
jgi:5-methyltetrahydrofolate--homocysteine methyltransferase